MGLGYFGTSATTSILKREGFVSMTRSTISLSLSKRKRELLNIDEKDRGRERNGTLFEEEIIARLRVHRVGIRYFST